MRNDLVSRSYLLSEYDRQHEGPPGRARKIIEEAPGGGDLADPEYNGCYKCIHNDDTIEICILRQCIHALTPKECFKSRMTPT